MARLSCKYFLQFTITFFFFSTTTFGFSDFQRKVKGQEKAQNDAFHANLLKQIAETHSTSTNDSVNASRLSSDLEVTHSFVSFATNATNSLQIYTSDSLPTNPVPSGACGTAMAAVIPCNSTIPLMAISPYLFSGDLQLVCTNDCLVGLETYRAGVVSACGSYAVTDSSNNTYAPTLSVDYVSGPYVVQCLQDPGTGNYCGPIVQSYNTTNGLLSLPVNELCTYCVLETLNATLSNPTSYSVELANILSSAIGICGANFESYNITSSPGDQVVLSTPFGVNSTSAPTVDCSAYGRNITAADATNCGNIASQYSVSEYDVFSSNPFLSADCNITAGAALCVPQTCTTYTIAINDTCQSVAQLAGIVPGTTLNVTAAQIQSFNPDLGTFCQLMPLRVGKSICLSPNGGWPTVGATSQGNPSATPTTVAPIPSPTVSGTTSACGRYYIVKAGDVCQTVAIKNYITLSDFFTLNPEINANCTNLWLGYYYCAAPYPPLQTVTSAPLPTTNYTSATVFSFPIPTATNYTVTYTTSTITAAGISAPTNIAEGTRSVACGGYYDIQGNDTLDSVATLVGINASLLATWNVELSNGSLPAVGSAICILFPIGNYTLPPASRPTNAYANATTACAQYYTVKSGDGCSSIEDQFGLSNSQFDELNPGLASDCTNLILGLAYCVLPTVPFSASNVTGPPANVAPGTITGGCLEYYTVVSGDSCSVIEDKFNITLTDIITWNPEINSGCTNLQLGLAYCVSSTTPTGPPPPPANLASGSLNNCTTYYTVVSGDNCPAVESTYNISASDFFRWNPELSFTSCNILLGEAYCVAGGGDACGKIYVVQSGDFCSAITQSQSITQQELDALNPFLDSNCDLSVGERLCVG